MDDGCQDRRFSREIWTEYWRGGRRGCLTDEAPASARDHIAGLWRDWFRQQPHKARILDLACGAGEVARIAFSISAETQLAFVVEGVDLAELDERVETRASAGGTTMRLHGGIDIARLPFPDRSFDCAVSQFGIEYADTEAACRELSRVLKPGSSGLFLLHDKESEISAAAAERLQAFTSVIGDGDLFDRAKQAYEAIAGRAAELAVVSRLAKFRQSLRAATDAQAARFPWESNLREILNFFDDLARNARLYDPFEALRRLEDARAMIAAWKSRQELQLSAALDNTGAAALAELTRRSGLKPIELDVVKDPATGAILARQLTFAAMDTAGY